MKKLLSARFWIAIIITVTACVGYLKGLMATEAFMALAGAVIAHYYGKTRISENPLKKHELLA